MSSSPLFCAHCGATNQPVEASLAHPAWEAGNPRCFACRRSLMLTDVQGDPASTLPDESHSFNPGESHETPLLLQRYKLVKQVGTGGFGAVYKAEDSHYGRRVVAIKEISLHGLQP